MRVPDVTVPDVMDSVAVRTLRAVAHVAFAMVQLGPSREDVTTALDLEEGLAYQNRQLAVGASHVK